MGVCGGKPQGKDAKAEGKDAADKKLDAAGKPIDKKTEVKGILKDPSNFDNKEPREKGEGHKPHFQGLDNLDNDPQENKKKLPRDKDLIDLNDAELRDQPNPPPPQPDAELKTEIQKEKKAIKLSFLDDSGEKNPKPQTPKDPQPDQKAASDLEALKKKQKDAIREIERDSTEENVRFGQLKDQTIIVVTDNVRVAVK
jgi:hypothetical protein